MGGERVPEQSEREMLPPDTIHVSSTITAIETLGNTWSHNMKLAGLSMRHRSPLTINKGQ